MVLIIGSIQYVSADHSLGDDGIFKDETRVNVTDSIGSKWLMYTCTISGTKSRRSID